MKITTQKFTLESYKDQASWIGKLFSPLNSFIGQIATIFQNNISVQDNLYQEVKEIRFLNENSYFPIKFKTKFNKYPQIAMVGACVDENGQNTLTAMNWSFENGTFSINSLSGLSPSTTYAIKLLIIYE